MVAVGVTDLEVCPVTVTLPGSSLKAVAPVTDHDRTEDCPLVIEPGEAPNEEIVGRDGGGGVGVGVGDGVGVGVGVGNGPPDEEYSYAPISKPEP